MNRFDGYRDSFPNARLTRSQSGVLEVALHTDGGTLVFNGHTHEQFVDLFHAIGADPDNRVVILTGSGTTRHGGYGSRAQQCDLRGHRKAAATAASSAGTCARGAVATEVRLQGWLTTESSS